MPIETILPLAAVTFVFVIFGVVLAWAQRQTRQQ
jgi:hypothetical protein